MLTTPSERPDPAPRPRTPNERPDPADRATAVALAVVVDNRPHLLTLRGQPERGAAAARADPARHTGNKRQGGMQRRDHYA